MTEDANTLLPSEPWGAMGSYPRSGSRSLAAAPEHAADSSSHGLLCPTSQWISSWTSRRLVHAGGQGLGRPESLNPERRGIHNLGTTVLDAVQRKRGYCPQSLPIGGQSNPTAAVVSRHPGTQTIRHPSACLREPARAETLFASCRLVPTTYQSCQNLALGAVSAAIRLSSGECRLKGGAATR
jgi:hypothetical protein